MDSSRVLDPEAIAVRAGREPSFLRLPAPATLFGERAMRLRQLAATSPAMADYLAFAAALSAAQHEAVIGGGAAGPGASSAEVPGADVFERAARDGLPPLPADDAWRDPHWHAVLRQLLSTLVPSLEAPAAAVVGALADVDDDALDALARRLLAGQPDPADLAPAPFVAAALQVRATLRVAAAAATHADLRGGAFGRIDDVRACPACGGPPTASVLQIGPDVGGQRYLHCAWCATQWHLVRITCAGCGNVQGLEMRHLQPAALSDDEAGRRPAVVRAECCPACGGYLKCVARDQDPNADPVADDVGTLALDVLLGDEGRGRIGLNYLVPAGPASGSASGSDAPDATATRANSPLAPPGREGA
jgi:FdhE protein